MRIHMLLAVLLVVGAIGAPSHAGDCSQAPEKTFRDSTVIGGRPVPEWNMTCFPTTLHTSEKQWTFFLRGPDALKITGGRLFARGTSHPHVRITYPTPHSALIDFVYPVLNAGDAATLILMQGAREMARLELPVKGGEKIRPDRRQAGRVRLQLQPWTLDYPLHGFRGDRSGIDGRWVAEVGGNEEFLDVLRDLGIERMRKVMSRYAEDDSVHWDPRFFRELFYKGEHLRQYLVFFEEGRSEAAFREIFMCFAEVEDAFINEDKSKRRK